MKLALGTAQFGMAYGVSNRRGRPDDAELMEILAAAARTGIDLLDTAPDYGDAEERIGTVAKESLVVTKISPGVAPMDSLRASLRRLRRDTVYACLFHRVSDLLGPTGEANATALVEARRLGLAKKVGVSIYGPDDIDAVLRVFRPDVVQLPSNVFDQRLLKNGYVRELKRMGVEIHVRSVFLQGLLLMDPGDLPERVSSAGKALQSFNASCQQAGCSRIEAALAYARSVPEFDRVIVGVSARSELDEIAAALERPISMDFSAHAVDDERITVPSNWK